MATVVDKDGVHHESPIHVWFGLTYSSYLVLQRSVLQAMPLEWQERMVALLNELTAAVDRDKFPSKFTVLARDGRRFVKDPFRDYRRPPPIPWQPPSSTQGDRNG